MNQGLPPAGWYNNAAGQLQWWDGYQWGILAEQYEQQQQAQQPQQPQQPTAYRPVAQEFSREYLEAYYRQQ